MGRSKNLRGECLVVQGLLKVKVLFYIQAEYWKGGGAIDSFPPVPTTLQKDSPFYMEKFHR